MICKCGHEEEQHDLESKGECTASVVGGIGRGFCICVQFEPAKRKRGS